jgi:hypothetical protein
VSADDEGVSFTVRGFYYGRMVTLGFRVWGAMCVGSTSREAFRGFQLESLILAQNERWRQA